MKVESSRLEIRDCFFCLISRYNFSSFSFRKTTRKDRKLHLTTLIFSNVQRSALTHLSKLHFGKTFKFEIESSRLFFLSNFSIQFFFIFISKNHSKRQKTTPYNSNLFKRSAFSLNPFIETTLRQNF
ncbi:hypothetical protein SAMN05443634_10127 [Chishuiella changwenlii]|uniref:Uncharacterized protein n=1 Tax=Chishuiella changwenlii TaxID=1434701 RepID=A0A1M6SL93_9FLAO|nr:hypothetical protein SAMN05443634_10127 [Chishuiella changwenlii]